jgi:uncharacterized protein involved in exopolysaccharide biosynthesis
MTVDLAPAEDLRMDAGALLRAVWVRALRIVLVTAFMVAVAYGLLMFVPKLYESTASLLVEDRTSSFTEATGTPSSSGGGGITIDALLSSQIELIKSRDTLLAVADQLNLRALPEFNGAAGNPVATVLALVGRAPAPKSVDETVVQNLSDRLTVIRERDSAVISISVRTTDPQLSAKLANAIAAEDVKRRAEQSVTDTKDATAWLQQQIDQLRVKVEEADSKVADFRAKNAIFAGANGTTLPDQQISDIGKQITDAQAAKGVAKQHADLIRRLLKSGESVEGVEDVRNSPVVQGLMQNRATLQSTLAEKLATLLPAHPTIKALNAQIAQVNQQIKAEARRIADGLDAQATAQDGILQTLNDDLKRAQLAASTQTKDGVTLDSLTREAKAQRDLLDAYLLKYRDASGRTTTGAVLPDVRIITEAAPSFSPASPKTTLILGAVGIVSLVLQVGWVLFGELMSGRAVYDRNAVRPFAAAGAAEPPVDADDLRGAQTIEADVDAPERHRDDDTPEPVAIADPGPLDEAPESPPDSSMRRYGEAADAALAMSNLRADVVTGRARVLFLAGVSEGRDAAVIADMLVADTLRQGLSVCRVDAGSGKSSREPGLTDLCAEGAGFGDVVHKVRGGLAEVPWGHLERLDHRSTRAVTLVEALADIYEAVVVTVGRLGPGSSLPVFEGAPGRLVLVRRPDTPTDLAEALAADAAAIGFDVADAVMLPEAQSEVA